MRVLLVSGLVVLVGCAAEKSGAKRNATAEKSAANPTAPTPTTTSTQPKADPVTVGASGGDGAQTTGGPQPPPPPGGGSANPTEVARAQGGLGVTTDPAPFEPLPADTKVQRAKGGGDLEGRHKPELNYTVYVNKPLLESKTDAVAIERALQATRGPLTRCYIDAAAAQRHLGGSMRIEFAVAADGTFSAITIKESSFKHADLAQCVTDALAKAKLPAKPKAATKGNVLLEFKT